mmetsp:Transcript_31020/g.30567  ORF Transcript_31020/g.30567 Transcript_31020/m.30567 type:complete len:139 (+) Transcript_31020:101-517(+)
MYYFDKKDREFKEMNLEGALCFVVDRILKTRFLMLYSLQNYTLLMYTELYVNFNKNFVKLNPHFYSFPCEDMILGICFGEKEDGAYFNTLVQRYSITRNEMKEMRKREEDKPLYHTLDPKTVTSHVLLKITKPQFFCK